MDFRYIKNKKHIVFDSIEEFEKYFSSNGREIPKLAEDWRIARKGDWVEADDGGVCQIIAWGPMKHPNDRKNFKNNPGWCRTVVGSFPQSKYVKMDTDFTLHPDRYRFGGATQQEINERLKTREKLSNNEVIFVTELCAGKTLQQAYEEAYGPHEDWRQRALFLLKRQRIMTAINKNIEEIAVKLGIDYEYILSKLKELVEKTKNDNIKLGGLKELGDWLGGKEKTKQITKGEVHVLPPFSSKDLAKIEAEKIETIVEAEEYEED